MPMRIGLIAYPMIVAGLFAARPNAVAAFERAKAYSPEIARTPDSLHTPHTTVRKAVKKRLLIPVNGGRYYVDKKAVARRDRNFLLIAGGLALVVTLPFIMLMW